MYRRMVGMCGVGVKRGVRVAEMEVECEEEEVVGKGMGIACMALGALSTTRLLGRHAHLDVERSYTSTGRIAFCRRIVSSPAFLSISSSSSSFRLSRCRGVAHDWSDRCRRWRCGVHCWLFTICGVACCCGVAHDWSDRCRRWWWWWWWCGVVCCGVAHD
ncbi:hypothetical protein BC567DRAFT_228082 [Phyllosticta citribraziliensis]